MAKYYTVILAVNLLFGALLFYFGHAFGLRKRTPIVITCVSIVLGFSFPFLLAYLKLTYVILIMFLVALYLAIIIYRENQFQTVAANSQETVELKTAEQYLQDVSLQQAATSESPEQYTIPLYEKESLQSIVDAENEPSEPEPVKEIIENSETEETEELIEQIEQTEETVIPADLETEEVQIITNDELEQDLAEEFETETEEVEEEVEEYIEDEIEEIDDEQIDEPEQVPVEEFEDVIAEGIESAVELEEEIEAETDVEVAKEREEEPAHFTVELYINQAFTYRAQSDNQGALKALATALELTTDVNLNLLITLEISTIYKESGQYDLAASIIGAYLAQFGRHLNGNTRLELLLNYQYIEIIRDLLLDNDLAGSPLKSIPELIVKQAEEKLEEWKRQLLA